MSTIMLVALVVIFAVILTMRRRRGPRVTEITRTVEHKKDRDDA
jgi:hypothetical protein